MDNENKLKKDDEKIINDYGDYLLYNKNYSLKTVVNYKLDLSDFFLLLEKEKINYKKVTYDILMDLFKHFEDKNLSNKSISRHISAIKGFYKYIYKVRTMIAENKSGYKLIEYIPINEEDVDKYENITSAGVVFEVNGKYLIGWNNWRKQ